MDMLNLTSTAQKTLLCVINICVGCISMHFGFKINWILLSVATSTAQKYKRLTSTMFWLDMEAE